MPCNVSNRLTDKMLNVVVLLPGESLLEFAVTYIFPGPDGSIARSIDTMEWSH